MKLTFSGSQCTAGITRSPSFSRLSSSIRMNIWPLFATAMISSIGLRYSENGMASGSRSDLTAERELARDVPGEHVDLDVDLSPGSRSADW